MRYSISFGVTVLVVLGLAMGWMDDAAADREAGWRVELSGGPGVFSGDAQRREGDFILKAAVEYELPLCPHVALGLRMLPAFVYDQAKEGRPTVWGGGVGVAGRFYWSGENDRGLFGEIDGHLIGHDGRFYRNGSNINFLVGAGIGWQFENDIFVVARFEHISNSNINPPDGSVNIATIGVGYRF